MQTFLSKRLRKRIYFLLIAGIVFMPFFLIGCGGGGGDSSSGEVIIGLTDTQGDFLHYSVDVVSITLTKANGAVVETLPLSSRVDFAEYVEMTEFITAATIPSGIYTRAKIRLDYSNADIQVEEPGGEAVKATVQDRNGQPITTMDLTVRLDDLNALVIGPGIPSHLTLDFNLKVSNQVTWSGASAVVTVEPFLVAQVDEEEPKIHRVRGPLKSVDTAGSGFQIAIRPFHLLTGEFGSLRVVVNSTTTYEIDGVTYQGSSGLAALGNKPLGTATIAVGDLDPSFHRFVAQEVYAGSSVPFGTSDALTGSVTARSGDILTVRGATLVRAAGSVVFNDDVRVQLATTTIVTGQGTMGMVYTKNDISVGQLITAIGTLSGNPGSLSLDASRGVVRMLVTTLSGTVNSTTPGSPGLLNLNLQTINGRRVSLFNFAGTGTPLANDANPAQYEVNTGSLNPSGLSPGIPVRVRGLVRPFGQAPADFNAWTVIKVADLPAYLVFNWLPATSAPFLNSSSTGITLNPAGVGLLHHVLRGWVVTDVLPNSPVVQPKNISRGWYAIGYLGTVQVYTQFADYQRALESRISLGQKASLLGGQGTFSDATSTLSAGAVFMSLQ